MHTNAALGDRSKAHTQRPETRNATFKEWKDENETTDLINLAVVYLLCVDNVIYNDLL